MQIDQQALDELITRIVEAVHPLKIILFGSAARGEMGPESDVDLLAVMPEGTHRLHTAQFVRRYLFDFSLPFSVDVIVATPGQIERYRDDIGFIYYRALREGTELYAARGGTAVWRKALQTEYRRGGIAGRVS
jgi:predicted nucleotidyltransferase